jgi:hypothetical protein
MELDFSKKKKVSLGFQKGFSKMNEQDKKTENIMFRLSHEEKSYLDNICVLTNKKRSDIIRQYISEGISKDLPSYPTLF